MGIKEKLYKGAIYFFISFIALLLILTLGMPNFIGSSATATRFMAAKVGSEYITNKEVSLIADNMMNRQFQGQQLPDSFRQQIKSQAVEQAIWRKLFYLTSLESGLFPLTSAKNKITADYLKKNFTQFQNEEGFDFVRLEKEFLKPRQITLADLEMDALWSDGLAKNDYILRSVATVNSKEIVDRLLLKETKYSYEVWQLNSGELDKVLEKEAGITDQQIKEKFENEYLAKDPKALLTPAKRTLITQELLKDKRTAVETAWMERLKTEIHSMPFSSLKRQYGGTLAKGGPTPLETQLSGSLKTSDGKPASIGPFDTNLQFIEERGQAAPGDTLSLIKENNMMYAVKITAVEKPPASLLEWNGKTTEELETAFPKYVDQIKEIENQIKNEYTEMAYSEMLSVAKNEYTIKRYNQTGN